MNLQQGSAAFAAATPASLAQEPSRNRAMRMVRRLLRRQQTGFFLFAPQHEAAEGFVQWIVFKGQ
ncbi:hypothetical protein [Thauera sinica]|uniref:Uncharacterized protein n=1 Tax=Thauera sinica TaxID=2665146 RepID=A0ABW1AP92_9RHOO|nr:hypothetical protein [Thauera sp. K11]